MNKPLQSFQCAAALAAILLMAACSKAPEVTTAPPASTAAAGNVSDTDVNEHVKTALQQSEALKAFDIGVVTSKGDVRLIGTVNTQAQVDEAIRIARASDGAHAVHDELKIKP